ncbi:MAG: peptidase S8 [Actinobacteria bacterium ATB1]|nr:peptidase S8 [Actinobacteria bacterium ATB1]
MRPDRLRRSGPVALLLFGGLMLAALTATPSSTTLAVDDDPLRARQWGLDYIGADAAWREGTGEGVVIAVVDSGVDADHPDLHDQVVPGIDLVGDGDGTRDVNGHGTHVAGIAAATSGNGIGISGCAPGAKVMPVQVLDAGGAGTADVIAAGVRWAAANGADVVNLSLSEEGLGGHLASGGPLDAAIRYASQRGVVVVAAAGNSDAEGAGHGLRNYGAGVPVIVVAALDRAGVLTAFSNFGDMRAVAAPGVAILSTIPETPSTLFPDPGSRYATLDGTSMATPLVSCTAAILLGLGATPDDTVEIIGDTAAPLSDARAGVGALDLAAAVAAVESEGAEPGVPDWAWVLGSAAAGLTIGVAIGVVGRSRRRDGT